MAKKCKDCAEYKTCPEAKRPTRRDENLDCFKEKDEEV